MSRRTPNDAMIEDIHARIRLLDRGAPFIHIVEEAMTGLYVPREKQSDLKSYSTYYAHEHDGMLSRIQRIFAPLVGRKLVIAGQLGLKHEDGWVEHMAEYGPHGVTGFLVKVDGFVLEKSETVGLTTMGTQTFQYCMRLSGPDLKVSFEEPRVDLARYDLSLGVLVPIRGLGSGWWQQIVRIEEA